MRIGILGSWREDDRYWELRGSQQKFSSACREIGKALACLKQSIIAGSESPSTADKFVVEGFLEVAKNVVDGCPKIEVIRPAKDKLPFQQLAEEHPSLFTFHSPKTGMWQDTHLIALREADAMLTVGGMKGTYLSGLASIIAKKRLVPIACFGGASARLLRDIESLDDSYNISELQKLNGPWTSLVLETAIRLTGATDPPKILIVHGRSDDWLKLKNWLYDRARLAEVIVMQQEFNVGKTLPEKFESLASQVDAAIAIATPDDIGGLNLSSVEQSARARQNVWLEVGWFWGRLGRKKIMVLCKGQLEYPSDLHGIELFSYNDNPVERGEDIRLFISQLKS